MSMTVTAKAPNGGTVFDHVRLRLSLCHGTMILIEPPEFVHAAADAGFTRVSLRFRNPSAAAGRIMGTVPLDTGDTDTRRRTKQALDERGIRVMEAEACVISPGCDLNELHGYMESAALLEALGLTTVYFGQTSEAEVIDQLGAFSEMANGYGLKTLIEFIAKSGIPNIQAAEQAIVQSGVANAGILVDTLHVTRSGGTPEDISSIRPDLIATLQINDGPRHLAEDRWWHEMTLDRKFLGEGDFLIREMVEHVPAHVPIGVEVISEPFQNLGLSAGDMARYAMNNARRFFGGGEA